MPNMQRTIAILSLLCPALPGCGQSDGDALHMRAGAIEPFDSDDSGGGPGSTDSADTGSGGDSSGDTGEFIDLWLPGGDTDDTGDADGGDDFGDGGDAGSDTGEGEDTGKEAPKGCADGEFTIHVYVKFKHGAEGSFSIATGTLTKVGEETEGTTVYKQYLACIPGDKIVGPKAPGVRLTAAVAGTNPADRVVGMRRGIDKNWIGSCLGNPAKSCWIDAKFNADGKNTLPIAVAVVYAELDRIETAPPPREVPVPKQDMKMDELNME